MSFRSPMYRRDVAALMTGDLILDGAVESWMVSEITAAGLVLDGVVGGVRTRRTVGPPPADARVEMSEGPGWGAAAHDERALAWAQLLVAEVLGGREIDSGSEA